MRDYAKVMPKFWLSGTGKRIRKEGGPKALLVALYLMTSPHSNMLGLYIQPIEYMGYETGLGFEGAREGLDKCIELGFCRYDDTTETVWVIEMAKYQIANELKASDNRCAGIQKDYDALHDNPFLGMFFDAYRSAYHLKTRRSEEGAFEPLRSQEQEQEQEQEQDIPPPDGGGSKILDGKNGHDLLGDQDMPGKRSIIPVQDIVKLYHAKLPMLPKVEKITAARRGQIQQRWREDLPTLDAWSHYFDDVAQSHFLTGRVPGRDGKPPFVATLDWLTKAGNFAKVAEGNYHRE